MSVPGAAAPSLPVPERVAIMLSLATYTDAERAELAACLADPAFDWARLHALLAHNVVLPQAYRQLRATGNWESVPAELARDWAGLAAAIGERNHARLETARPLFAAMADAGIRVALLKGIYFAPTYYGDPGYKRMNDIDYLIQIADLDVVRSLLHQHGYFSLGLIKDDDDRQTSFSHHMPPYFHPSLQCVLGTHWGLISPRRGYHLDHDAMWSRVVPFEFLGRTHQGLHPVDNLHHLCVHLPHYKTGLRELADIYNLLRAETARPGGFDWPLFEAEVRRAGTAGPVFHALSLVQVLVPIEGIAACLDRLRPSVKGFYLREARLRTRVPARLLSARSILTSTIDKQFGVFVTAGDLRSKWRAWLAMWKCGLWAPHEDIARFHCLDPADPALRLRTVSMLGRVLGHGARDLGWGIYLALLVKLKLDLVKAVWRTLRGTVKPNKLEAAAAAHGLDRAQLEGLLGLLE